jgi:hypothetical protein
LNVHGSGGVRENEMRAVVSFVPECSAYEVEVAIGNFKRYKSPDDLIQAGGGTLHSEIHKLKFIWNKEELQHQWKK